MQPQPVKDLPSALQQLLSSAAKTHAEAYSLGFAGELQRCFGPGLANLVRRGPLIENTGFRVKLSESAKGLAWEMISTGEDLVTKQWTSKIARFVPQFSTSGLPWRMLTDEKESYLLYTVREQTEDAFRGLINRSYYLPAARSGILLGHKTLTSLIVGRASLAWIEPMEIPKLPGVITDLIQALLFLGRTDKPTKDIQKVVAFLEGEVTKGTVDVDPQEEYPDIFYQNTSGKYRLHQVSSMVAEIAPLILFLKYLIRSGDLFIIEEPESHIDADNQRLLARAIAMLVHAGVQVLVTTHSDYFVSQLNNLLLLSQHSLSRRTPRGYTRADILDPSNVAAYEFRPGVNGTRVRSRRVDAINGIPLGSFSRVHAAIYDEALALEHP